MLNKKNSITEKIIHIMVTTLCNRNCKHCCNKQYSLDAIPYVTDEELRRCHTVCITGGEPFEFSNPANIAKYYKRKYPNIKKVYVYTNAMELNQWLKENNNDCSFIDGVNVSIKVAADKLAFAELINDSRIQPMSSNLLYVFDGLNPDDMGNFTDVVRTWQPDFVPAADSIFRKA